MSSERITNGEFQKVAIGYEIPPMQTVSETRRNRLEMLIERHGSVAELNTALGWARTDPKLAQIRNANIRKGRAKPHQMGDAMAREIEEKLTLALGWMDTPPYAPEPSTALHVRESVKEYEVTRQYDIYTMAVIGIMLSLQETQREGALAALRTHVQNLGPPRDGQALSMAA